MMREDRWQSKAVLSTAHQLAAKVPLLSVRDMGWGGTSSNCADGQLQRQPAVSPSCCLGVLVLVLATLSCQFVLQAHLNAHWGFSSFLPKGVCRNKHISGVVLSCFTLNKAPWQGQFLEVIDKSAFARYLCMVTLSLEVFRPGWMGFRVSGLVESVLADSRLEWHDL